MKHYFPLKSHMCYDQFPKRSSGLSQAQKTWFFIWHQDEQTKFFFNIYYCVLGCGTWRG